MNNKGKNQLIDNFSRQRFYIINIKIIYIFLSDRLKWWKNGKRPYNPSFLEREDVC